MSSKNSVVKQVLETLVGDTTFVTEVGISSYEKLEGWYNTLDGYQQIEIVARAVNNLEGLDPLLDSITKTATNADYSEVYTRAVFEESGWDLETESRKPEMQDFSISYKDYGTSIRISNKQMLKDSIGVVQNIIDAVVPAYRAKTRLIKLSALLTLPTAESKKTACLWRDTSGFAAAADQIAPHPNGLVEFANTDTHYIWHDGMDVDALDLVTDPIISKGYGRSGIAIVANRTWWKAYKAEFTTDELTGMKLRNELAVQNFPTDETEVYIQLPDSDFPSDYALAFDPTVQGIHFKISEDPAMQGLVPGFKSLDELRVVREADFNIYDVGAGIRERGFAAVLYNKTSASAYVSPTLTLKG